MDSVFHADSGFIWMKEPLKATHLIELNCKYNADASIYF